MLQASGQICLIEPWFGNQTKQIIKSPKVYFCDVGLLRFLLGMRSSEGLFNSPYLGAIWETFVFSELRKKDLHEQGRWNWNFYRDKTREIDFVRDEGGIFTLIECKWSENPTIKDTKYLRYFSEHVAPGHVKKSYVLGRPHNAFPLNKNVEAINLHDFLNSG